MKDGGRLTAADTTELEHRLLQAARKVRMPDDMTSRMRQGLGFGATAAGGGTRSLKVGGAVVFATVAIVGVAGTIGGWFRVGSVAGAREVVVTAPATEPPAAAPEAVLLRVEELARRGETDKARALATRFLAEHPDSRLAERVARFAR